MNCFNSMVENIITYLSKDEGLSDVSFLRTYPLSDKPSPIDKVYITVGLMGIDILKKTFSDYIGDIANKSVYGRQANMSLSIKVYSPRGLGGEGCMEVFERVCSSLMFGQKEYAIQSIECRSIDYDLHLTSLILSSTVKFEIFLENNEV